jgi:eukaryotic-like serine/threonine-protein kinase
MSEPMSRLSSALADHYRLERELGAGGMATVYLGRDVRHDRDVAIKVLHPELAAVLGAERFLAEIKTTAKLQHPHIVPLLDSGEVDGQLYYVMPVVEGESLRARLYRETQLPLDDALRIAKEVASALDYAHRHGVIHRDIKPENILLHDGQAIVSDFGIALAVSAAGGARMTQTGLSLGTPQYMSPEQATGERTVDARSDVYSLGCVLYEMLTGTAPFTGPTAQAIIAQVITSEAAPVTAKRATVPQHIANAIRTAIQKLPADRFASAAEFARALEGKETGPLTVARVAAPSGQREQLRPGISRPIAIAGGVIALLLGAIVGRVAFAPPAPPSPAARLSIAVAPDVRLNATTVGMLALSPDGSTLVYVGESQSGSQLYARTLDQLAAVPIAGTLGAGYPTFAPDGRSVAFFIGPALYTAPLTGGTGVKTNAPPGLLAAIWTSPQEFVVTTADGVLARLHDDGTLQPIASPVAKAGETALIATDALPNGDILVLAATQGRAGPIARINGRTGARTRLSSTIANAAWLRDGELVWVEAQGTAGVLVSAPVDERSGRLKGPPVMLAPDIRVSAGGQSHVVFSRNGAFAYMPALPSELVAVDRTGRAEPVADIQRRFHGPHVAPDGRHILVDFLEQSERDVRVLDLGDRTFRRLTFEKDGHDGLWMPSGDRILYMSGRSGTIGIWGRRADGSGTPDSVLALTGKTITAHAVTPDGKALIAVVSQLAGASTANNDIAVIHLGGERVAEPFVATQYSEGWPSLSPDGHWLAYASDESGRFEVYVRPFPGPGGQVLISRNGGSEPVWSRDGRELFYRGVGGRDAKMVAASIQTEPAFRVVNRVELFPIADYENATPHANYDVLKDGRFLMIRQPRVSEVVYVLNWRKLEHAAAAVRR